MSGCAWRAVYSDGSVTAWIEAPRPKGPMSLAIFLHEVGHHAVGFDGWPTRCAEELAAWEWALAAMRAEGIAPTARVERRFELSMRYALAKALRRGLRRVPPELVRFLP